jgi:hypothetical protein
MNVIEKMDLALKGATFAWLGLLAAILSGDVSILWSIPLLVSGSVLYRIHLAIESKVLKFI